MRIELQKDSESLIHSQTDKSSIDSAWENKEWIQKEIKKILELNESMTNNNKKSNSNELDKFLINKDPYFTSEERKKFNNFLAGSENFKDPYLINEEENFSNQENVKPYYIPKELYEHYENFDSLLKDLYFLLTKIKDTKNNKVFCKQHKIYFMELINSSSDLISQLSSSEKLSMINVISENIEYFSKFEIIQIMKVLSNGNITFLLEEMHTLTLRWIKWLSPLIHLWIREIASEQNSSLNTITRLCTSFIKELTLDIEAFDITLTELNKRSDFDAVIKNNLKNTIVATMSENTFKPIQVISNLK